jgi:hypothetical protein
MKTSIIQKEPFGRTNFPFFLKERNNTFFNSNGSFFTPQKNSSTSILQTELTISQPSDKHEKEAGRIANAVVKNNNAAPPVQTLQISRIQRKCTECEHEEKEIQEKAENNTSEVSPSVSHNLENTSGKGNPLPVKILKEMNSSFCADFSSVNNHNDSESVNMNKDLHAQAFTHGSDIYFNAGKYNPETKIGKQLLAHELTHVVQQNGNRKNISRKIEVPFEKSKPRNSKNPAADTQGKVVEKYLNKLCVVGGITMEGKKVNLPVDLCDLPGPIEGNMALTKAEQSKTKVGCTCLCELDKSKHTVKVIVDDDIKGTTLAEGPGVDKPGVGAGSTVTVPSPDAPQTVLPTQSGKMLPIDPVINLGHELCGHAFFNVRGESMKDHSAQRGRGGHQATIERENLIRDEQGVERRATFRQPFCGEFQDSGFIEECKKWRKEFNMINNTNFKIEDTIPENPLEKKPADFRIDVFFNKDMPQSWFNPATSFNVSVTQQGKENFGFALAVFQDHPDKKFQLEAHASSDKPKGDDTYNQKLSERRMRLTLKELTKRGIDPKKLADKEDSACSTIESGLKNCSDTEAGTPGTESDRKVVIRLF